MRPASTLSGRGIVAFSILLFCAALALHLLYLGEIDETTFFTDPMLDSANYHAKALDIVDGTRSPEGVLTHNPLYPFILSVLYRFMEEPSFYAVRVVQSILGALSCVLILLAGIRYLDCRTGLLAGAAALLYAPFVFFSGELIQSAWVLFFFLLSFVILPLRRPEFRVRWLVPLLLSGGCFGVGLLGRPNMLPYLVVF